MDEVRKPSPTRYAVDLEMVIDNLPSAIIVVDGERRVLLANRLAACFAGRTRHDLLGQRGGEAFGCVNATLVPKGCGAAPECELCDVRRTVLTTFALREDRPALETALTVAGKGRRDLRISAIYLAPEGVPLSIVSLEDITDLKAQKRIRLEHAQLSAAVETCGSICHEMNQPLTVLSGQVALMLHGGGPAAPQGLRVMREQIQRLGEMTSRLMRLAASRTKAYAQGRQILDLEASSTPSGEDLLRDAAFAASCGGGE